MRGNIEWPVSYTSILSINAAKRLGMTRDGVLRELPPCGERQGTEIWSVLAPEWRKLREQG
ncbi:hypothetical protein C5746_04775 [Streptomyces atratus]|uniref:Uncharacterized protein n=1 Tax=Streptomyces atratus TaxID=1893 RepID=A0A2Z5J7T7_STRAR|nr:hypothetical protein C5746_04775 [Streptomyces atratus]